MSEVNEFFEAMVSKFRADAAPKLEAIFQYELAEGDRYYILVESGGCSLNEGVHDDPSVTLKLKFATLKKLAAGELDGMKALMFGKLKVRGDIMLASRLTQLFPAS